jgi:mannose-6-phosphate isomerase-like protein (cupin superfamily)
MMFSIFSITFADDTTQTAPAKTSGIETVNINDIREFDKNDLLKKVPLTTDKFVFNAYFLEPRQLLKLHKHPTSDEFFYIVEGRGQFTVGNDQTMVNSGSAIYGPADVPHGLVNSGDKEIVMISVQTPKPVKMVYIENSSVACAVCGQENIVPEGAKEGDIITCPRCHAKLKLSKSPDGKWIATQL